VEPPGRCWPRRGCRLSCLDDACRLPLDEVRAHNALTTIVSVRSASKSTLNFPFEVNTFLAHPVGFPGTTIGGQVIPCHPFGIAAHEFNFHRSALLKSSLLWSALGAAYAWSCAWRDGARVFSGPDKPVHGVPCYKLFAHDRLSTGSVEPAKSYDNQISCRDCLSNEQADGD
jgi:hypothetical protein